MGLKITITDAGRAEVINASNTGTAPVEIAEIALGTAGYVPNPEQTELEEEVTRLSTIAGEVVSPDTIHVTAKDLSNDAYDVQEFGLITEHGTLFAVYSDPEGPFMQKAAASSLLLAVDVILGTLDATNVTFGDTSFSNPPASQTVAGVIRTANQSEVDEGTDDTTAVTPKKAAGRYVPKPVLNGGTTHQLLRKKSNTDLDVEWFDPETGRLKIAIADISLRNWTQSESDNLGSGQTANRIMPSSFAYSQKLGLYVLVCGNESSNISGEDKILNSLNGVNWNVASFVPVTDSNFVLKSVIWDEDNDFFVAVGINNSFALSNDGGSWTANMSDFPIDGEYHSLVRSRGREQNVTVAVGPNSVSTYTDDPEAWTPRTVPESNDWEDVVYAESIGRFIAVASTGTNRVMISEDGENWTAHAAADQSPWSSVAWSEELGLAIAIAPGTEGENFMASEDGGVTWSSITDFGLGEDWRKIEWSSGFGVFVALKRTTNASDRPLAISSDGVSWREYYMPVQGLVSLNHLGPDRDQFIVGGDVSNGQRVATSL